MRDLGLPCVAMVPPAGAEPAPQPGEDPSAYALRAAEAKARSVLPLLPLSVFTSEAEARMVPALNRSPCRSPYQSSDRPPDPAAAAEGPVVIAADTVVVLDGRILGKPADPDQALGMLASLSGREHEVITGCVLLGAGRGLGPRGQAFAQTAQAPGAGARNPDPGQDDPPPQPPQPCAMRSFAVRSRVRMWDVPHALLAAYARSGEPMDKAGAYAVQGSGAFLVQSVHGSWSNVVGLPLAELTQALLALDAIASA